MTGGEHYSGAAQDAWDRIAVLEAALQEIGTSYGVECSYAHGVDCHGNTVLREIARAALAAGSASPEGDET